MNFRSTVLGCVCLLVLAWGCHNYGVRSVVETAIISQLNDENLVIASKLRDWKRALGEPSVVEQKDLATTFFYWPESGVAVFCHPHYLGQYRYEDPEDWVVTRILLPLRNSIPPLVPSAVPDLQIRFTRLLLSESEISKFRVKLRTNLKFHSHSGVLSSVEVRIRDGLFGDYD